MPNQLTQQGPTEPLPHKSTHQEGGRDELDLSGLEGKSLYVDRGDPAAVDFTVGDLTTDGAFHELDLSGIVPAGTKAVHIRVVVSDDLISQAFLLRKKGNTNAINTVSAITQVANIAISKDGIVSCSTDRKLEYSATNTTWTWITILVKGYFI